MSEESSDGVVRPEMGSEPEEESLCTVLNDDSKVLGKIGFRHVQMLVLFLGLVLAYGMRVTMSVAIVAMTNNVQGNKQEQMPINWTSLEQAVVLSAFMVGNVITQIPGRRLATWFGGKILVVVGVAGSAVVAAFIPLGAYDGDWELVAGIRLVQGLMQGAMVPGVLNLINKWMPLNERKSTEAIMYCAMPLGAALDFLVSGLVISSLGWSMVFYLNTITGAVWSIIYIILGSKSAETSKFISSQEKSYIKDSQKQDYDATELRTPWYAFWTSVPFLSLVIANCGQNWGIWTLMTLLPTYLYHTQELDIFMNGAVSAIPFIAMFVMILPFSCISNFILKKSYVSVTKTRKIFSGIGFLGPGIGLIVLAIFDFNTVITTAVLALSLLLNAAQYSGYMQSHEDMAPNFSRRMGRITNAFANLLAVFAPLTAGVMIQDANMNATGESVLTLCASMFIFCGIFYIVLGTSVRQKWNEPDMNSSTNQDPKERRNRNCL